VIIFITKKIIKIKNMKTKSNLKTLYATSVVFLLLLFSLMPFITKAQNTGALVGWGMGVCNTFTFNSTVAQPSISPLTYSNQNYACTGLNDDDISFNPQGNSWRVEIKSWTFTPLSTSGATLSGVDINNTNLPGVVLTNTDVLSTSNYTIMGSPPTRFCQFIKNNVLVTATYYNATNWQIYAP
jgi:hypothetical protein